MKVIISRLELLSLIGKIQNIVASKPTLPILANILIEAIDDQLILSATDLMVSMRVYAEAKVLEEGSIALPARRLFSLIRELTAPQVEIHTLSPEIATINAGSSHFKINGMHKSEFPILPDLSEAPQFDISASTLKEMLSRVAFAAAREDSRHAINSVLLQNIDQVAVFTSTDGKRMAKIHSAIDFSSEHPRSHILPLKAVEEIIRLLDIKEEEPAKIHLMPDKIGLEIKSTLLIAKILSGDYPDVARVIPQETPLKISLHREELIALLRQVSLFASENNHSVRFTFLPGELHLSTISGEMGEGKVQMPVNYGGERLDIAFNPTYFLDILRHCKDETVTFNLVDSYNPGVITDSTTAQYVIMPMRLERTH